MKLGPTNKKPGAKPGNTNAMAGESAKTATLQIRVTPAQKLALKRAAGKTGLSTWALDRLLTTAACRRCHYPFGDDWLDDGETCPNCKLVN